MDLRSDNPYWLLKSGLINLYPSLRQNIHADITVMGAGITGALIAWHLYHAGLQVTVIDRRHVATGSTSATTGLLQYEIDVPLTRLTMQVGRVHAFRSYDLCRESIYKLEKICGQLSLDSEFKMRPSLQYASYKKDIENLKEEYELRKQHGYAIEWLETADIKNKFGFTSHAGVLSADGAEINAYKFTHGLLQYLSSKGVTIYDNTSIENVCYKKNGAILTTTNGHTIDTKKLIIACGYESQNYLKKKVEKWHSTYAIISEPFTEENLWYKNALIWETANPYLYLRTTADNRIIVGGMDDDFYNPEKRDKNISVKSARLYRKFKKKFNHLDFRTDFKWAGTFASTKDGLPYIGTPPGMRDTFFALGYGGNGITFSVIASAIITDLLQEKKNADADIFSFNR